MSNGVEIAPLRSLSDFLLESARFQVPNVKDMDKWSNRVSNNLLYYQTNYFFMSVIVFLVVGLFNPTKMVCGILAVAAVFGLFCYVTNSKRSATKFKRDHPVISLLVIFSGGYFVVYMLGSVLVFLFGIMLPVALFVTFCAVFVMLFCVSCHIDIRYLRIYATAAADWQFLSAANAAEVAPIKIANLRITSAVLAIFIGATSCGGVNTYLHSFIFKTSKYPQQADKQDRDNWAEENSYGVIS